MASIDIADSRKEKAVSANAFDKNENEVRTRQANFGLGASEEVQGLDCRVCNILKDI